MTDVETCTVDRPGARITYDVRGALGRDNPLLLCGSPMDAGGFTALAAGFTDRLVVTYDPRGTGRSLRTDGADQSTPQEHAGDIAAIIDALGAGFVDVFATSGGAVNALALIQHYPGRVAILVAHEPPLAAYLPDKERILATTHELHRIYLTDGQAPAMAKFIEFTMLQGEIPGRAGDHGACRATLRPRLGAPVQHTRGLRHPRAGRRVIRFSELGIRLSHRAIPMYFVSRYSSIPSKPPSRP